MPRYGPEAQERIRANSSLSIREFMRLLWPYFWPRGREHRLAAVGCFVALGLAKACTIVSPSYMGAATDALLRGEFPVGPLVAFALLRFAASAFEEVQRLVYLRVKQVAYHEIAVRTFAHLHSLSLHWHVSKRSGVVLRAMDRGISSAATVVDSLFLRLGPTLIEMAILVALFAQAYNSPGASASIAISSFLYIAVTVCLAQRRREKRMTMHKADNEANQIAVDTLTAFETVKAFNNEEYELQRYSAAVKLYQVATREQQASLVALNIAQSAIIRGATASVMLFAASDVLAGRMTTGNFVAMLTYVSQVFTPLSWLGAMYSMVVQAYTDMRNLTDLLREKPDVVDAPKAKQLRLANPGRGVTIEFRDVVFEYPEAALDNIEKTMAETGGDDDTAPGSGGSAGDKGRKRGDRSGREGAGAAAGATGKEAAAAGKRGAAGAASKGTAANRAGGDGDSDDDGGGTGKGGSSSERKGLLGGSGADTSSSGTGGSGTGAGVELTSTAGAPGAATSDDTRISVADGDAAAGDASSRAGKRTTGPTLKGISFTVGAGKTTAIVGPTGSGKSTISKLLFRYYDVGSGGIFIDGQDIRSVTQASLRSVIGLVPQDCVLFNNTLRFNMKYGRPTASDEEMIDAAEAAQIADFVQTLPQGYNTMVGERGQKLSGGERQRVSIARAMLKDSPVLVLDEATSAMDTLTESQIQAAVNRVRAGRTVISIAHRLSTIKDADEILVLANGVIEERGTHEQLLAHRGRYHALWSQQAAAAAQEAASSAAAASDGDVAVTAAAGDTAVTVTAVPGSDAVSAPRDIAHPAEA